jgi:hypothetical protein
MAHEKAMMTAREIVSRIIGLFPLRCLSLQLLRHERSLDGNIQLCTPNS